MNIKVLNCDRAGENVKCKISNANLLSSSSHKRGDYDFDINNNFKPFMTLSPDFSQERVSYESKNIYY